MNVCELNKFINAAGSIAMDCYQFNPVTEKTTISKGQESVVIDLNISHEDQLLLFQSFLNSLSGG